MTRHMSGAAWSIFAALVLSSGLARAAELDPPKIDDPTISGFISRYQADQARLRSGQLFKPPKKPPESVCPVPESLPYRLAELFDQHPDLKAEQMAASRAARRAARDAGTDPDALPEMVYSNVRVIPIETGCKDGVAEGRYAAYLSYDLLIDVKLTSIEGDKVIHGSSRTSIKLEARVETVFVAGVASSESVVFLRSVSSQETRYDDPVYDKFMRKAMRGGSGYPSEPMFSATYRAPSARATFTRMKIPQWTGGGKSKWVETLQTNLEYALDERRSQLETYHGPRLVSETRMLDGKIHGEKLTLTDNFYKGLGLRVDQQPGMENARELTIDGRDVIEIRKCYRDGREIKLVPCEVD